MSRASELIEEVIGEKSIGVAALAQRLGLSYRDVANLIRDYDVTSFIELYNALKDTFGSFEASELNRVSKAIVQRALDAAAAGMA